MGLMDKIFGTYSERELKRIYPIRDKVLALDEQFSKMSDQELKAMTPKLKERLSNGESLDDILPEAFATCREAAWRVLGMKHFPVQIVGGSKCFRQDVIQRLSVAQTLLELWSHRFQLICLINLLLFSHVLNSFVSDLSGHEALPGADCRRYRAASGSYCRDEDR